MQKNIGTELVNNAIKGDEKAFEELYMSTYRFVYAVAKYYLSRDEDIYDAIQDTYTRVYKGLSVLTSAFRHIIGTDLLSATVAQEILSNVRGGTATKKVQLYLRPHEKSETVRF